MISQLKVERPAGEDEFRMMSLPSQFIEREMKYVVPTDMLKAVGVDLASLSGKKIEQCYFSKEQVPTIAEFYFDKIGQSPPSNLPPLSQARVRMSKDLETGEERYELTLKSKRFGPSKTERIELPPLPLSADEYKALAACATAGKLCKTRYKLPVENKDLMIEIDLLAGVGPGKEFRDLSKGERPWRLATIDVECSTREALFKHEKNSAATHPLFSRAISLQEHDDLKHDLANERIATRGLGTKQQREIERAIKKLLD